jgi:hypothetical protein
MDPDSPPDFDDDFDDEDDFEVLDDYRFAVDGELIFPIQLIGQYDNKENDLKVRLLGTEDDYYRMPKRLVAPFSEQNFAKFEEVVMYSSMQEGAEMRCMAASDEIYTEGIEPYDGQASLEDFLGTLPFLPFDPNVPIFRMIDCFLAPAA